MIVRRISNDELYHHGVEGQRWGVKNGPPYPLDSSVSTGEKLKAQAKVRKLIKNKYITSYENSEAKQAAKDIAPVVRKEDIERLIALKKAWYDSDSPSFDESDEYYQAKNEAFNNTYDFYKKNEPALLKEWEKEVGEPAYLTDIHDFRKTYEGYTDEAYTKYEKLFKKRIKTKTEEDYFKEYTEAIKKYVDDLVGEEDFSIKSQIKPNKNSANRRVTRIYKRDDGVVSKDTVSVHNVVYWAIDELENNSDKYFK